MKTRVIVNTLIGTIVGLLGGIVAGFFRMETRLSMAIVFVIFVVIAAVQVVMNVQGDNAGSGGASPAGGGVAPAAGTQAGGGRVARYLVSAIAFMTFGGALAMAGSVAVADARSHFEADPGLASPSADVASSDGIRSSSGGFSPSRDASAPASSPSILLSTEATHPAPESPHSSPSEGGAAVRSTPSVDQGATRQAVSVCKAAIYRSMNPGESLMGQAVIRNAGAPDVLVAMGTSLSPGVQLVVRDGLLEPNYRRVAAIPVPSGDIPIEFEVAASSELEYEPTDRVEFRFRNAGTVAVTATIYGAFADPIFPAC